MPAEETSSSIDRGKSLSRLLIYKSQEWVHRRVDALRLGTEGGTRRTVSLDITVPEEFAVPGSKNRVVIPLALIEKSTLRSFDAEDSSGHPIPVLGTTENSILALELLSSLIPGWIRKDPQRVQECERHLKLLVEASPNEAESRKKEFQKCIDRYLKDSIQRLTSDDTVDLVLFEEFAGHLSHNFLLLAEIDRTLVGTRHVVKYSYDFDLPTIAKGGSRTVGFSTSVPDFGFAASQHLEVEVPPELTIDSLLIVESDLVGEPLGSAEDSPERERPLAHVALAPESRFSGARFTVNVVPSGQGIYAFTRLAVSLVGVAVAMALAVKLHLLAAVTSDAKIPSPSASILLIGPALLLSWLSRSPEHELTVRLLRPLRWILMLSALALLLMAGAAAVPLQPSFWHALWWVVLAVEAAAAVWLLSFRFDFARKLRARRKKRGAENVRLRTKEGVVS